MALNTGIGGSTASEEYGGLMVLPKGVFTLGGVIAAQVAGPVSGLVDVSFFRLGRGQFVGRTTWTDPIMEPSNAATAMIGLELADPDREGAAPFVSGSVGL